MSEHGIRKTYLKGCRCEVCRKANTEYARRQRHNDCSLVGATRARNHLKKLSTEGVGAKSVSEACGVAICTIKKIRQGRQRRILKRTHERVMNVTKGAACDTSKVDRKPLDRMLTTLKDEGFNGRQLARALGYKGALQFSGRRVHAKSIMRVEKFYNRIMVA